jgi:sporulation protein YlmC with PRC-barrel domain
MSNARTLSRGLLIVGLVAALCACGLAAQGATTQQGQATPPGAAQPGAARPQTAPEAAPSPGMAQGMMLERTSKLIGKEVKDPQGQKLGVIHDIVLTPDYQQVSYVAFSSGGVFGVGRKLHAIPWQALHVSTTGAITLSTTPEQLKQAASFPNENWPSQGDSQWLKGAAAGQNRTATNRAAAGQEQKTEGESPAAEPAPQARQTAPSMGTAGQGATANAAVQMRRVTHLTGMEVKNPEGQDLGDIEDFAVNASDGRIIYDIIAFGGVAGIGEKFAAVPANAVRLQPQAHAAMLNATAKTLESAVFTPSEFASLGSAATMQRLNKLFPAAPGGTALGYTPPESAQMRLIADERAWGAEGSHGKAFNPSTVKTITGTVESIGSFKPEGAPAGATGGLRLRVKTTSGQIVTVFAGPISYAEQKDFYVMPGDQISITGSEAKVRSRTVILASELKKGSQTLELRDKSGKPLWAMEGPGSSPAPGAPASRTR